MAHSKSCKKGFACGLSCISANKDCISEFPPVVQPFLEELSGKLGGYVQEEGSNLFKQEEFVSKLSKLAPEKQQFFAEMAVLIMGSERDKSDKFAFSEEEALGMQARSGDLDRAYEVSFRKTGGNPTAESLRAVGGIEDYLESHRTRQVSDEEVDILWDMLPVKIRRSLGRAGSVKAADKWKGGTRAKELLKIYMRQGGRDIYTGKPLPLMEADLEHIIPFEVAGRVAEDPANWGWTRSGINTGRGKRDISDYISKNVSEKLGLSLGDSPAKAKADSLETIREEYERVREANRSRKEARKNLESSDWLREPKEKWSEEQKEIFTRMTEGLSDPAVGKGYYVIEKMFPEFKSSAAIHPLKRSSRRKVWLQELGQNLTRESLEAWAGSEGEERRRIEEFWKKTGGLITEEIKAAGLYDEAKVAEATALAKQVVQKEWRKLKND